MLYVEMKYAGTQEGVSGFTSKVTVKELYDAVQNGENVIIRVNMSPIINNCYYDGYLNSILYAEDEDVYAYNYTVNCESAGGEAPADTPITYVVNSGT